MPKRILIAALCILPIFAASSEHPSFTLEQVLSAPFPSDLVGSRTGDRVAWVLNEKGARNVWVAQAPDYKGVRLTGYAGDDGTDLGMLHWAPDGKGVVYVRGGDLEFPGLADPNPSANPAGAEQAIWYAAVGSQAPAQPKKLADGHSPAISPKGDVVAFLRAGQVWTVALNGGKPEQLIKARAGVSASGLVWSPDGSKLAYVSGRGNHSFIAAYDYGSKSLEYLDPSVDRDTNPVWSADGKQVAFTRTGSEGGGRAARTAPWSIRVASVADGTGHQVWQAEEGPGSIFHALVSESQLMWAGNGKIVFPWERDGWQHLYAVPVAGGQATLLTPGNFEVEHVSYGEDGKQILYASNQGDIDRRHIWRVAVAGGAPQAVTKGEALEWSPVELGKAVAYLGSDPKRPARAILLAGSVPRDIAPDSVPPEFPVNSLVVPQQVIYAASDGMQIHGQLFLPPDLKPGDHRKALVFLHGGSRRQMLLGWHYMDYYNNSYGMNQFLASKGYIVLAINYRSGIGYGLNFREALNYGRTGASEYHDVEGAGLYLRSRPDVDPAHIGLWGGSYGGYLTAMGLARGSDLFAAGVDFHGVHEWNTGLGSGNRLGNSTYATANPSVVAEREQAARLAFESSPMADVKTWRSPVLLIHGDDDRNVNFAETIELANALRKQHVYFEQMILPDEIHGFLRHGSWLRAYHATENFFGRKL